MDALPPESQFDFLQLGRRLRKLREEKGWTFDDVAARAGLSASYLSRIESGDRQPPLGTLSVLARSYGVTLSVLFEPDDDPCIIVRGAEAPIQRGNDLLYTRLARQSRTSTLQVVRVQLSGQSVTTYAHEGEEWLYVLSGKLQLKVGDEVHLLEAGDAAHFQAAVPHSFSGAVEQITEILLVASVVRHPLLMSYL